jgi:hypothetical protein
VAWTSLFVVSSSGDARHGRLDLLIVRRKETHNGQDQLFRALASMIQGLGEVGY